MSKTVVGVSKGMLPVKHQCSNKAPFCICQISKEIIRLSQSRGEIRPPQILGYSKILNSGICVVLTHLKQKQQKTWKDKIRQRSARQG